MAEDEYPLPALLVDFRDRFSNRRTVPWEMFTIAEEIVVQSAEFHRRLADAAVVSHRDRIRDLEAQRADLIDQLEQATEDRKLREERSRFGDQVTVKIDRSLDGWVVADLEEVAYRLRCGGALDETPVKITDYTAQAVVPAPELVQLQRPDHTAKPPPPIIVTPPQFDHVGGASDRVVIGAAAALVLAMLCSVLAVVVFG